MDDLSQIAVGFANGSVTVIRGDLIHDRGARQRIVFESQEPITGLEMRIGSMTTLYIATTNRIFTLVVAGRGQGHPARVLEDAGCALGCITLDQDTGDILVAREDAIYTYSLRGRGPSYAFDSPKTSISIFREYIALVCPPRAKGDLARFGSSTADDVFSSSSFTLLDTDLKFIAHTETLASPVKSVFMEWGNLFLLTTDGQVCGFVYLMSLVRLLFLTYMLFTGLSVPRKESAAETGDPLPTKPLYIGHKPVPEVGP